MRHLNLFHALFELREAKLDKYGVDWTGMDCNYSTVLKTKFLVSKFFGIYVSLDSELFLSFAELFLAFVGGHSIFSKDTANPLSHHVMASSN